MTNYGAIPTSSHASPSPVADVESLSSDNQRTKAARAMPRRSWGVMLDVHAMGLPPSVSDASSRIKTNYNYFRMNYSIFISIIYLIVIYSSLIKHPVPLIAFTVLVLIYIFFFNLQYHEPAELFHYQINDWTFLIVKICLILLAVPLLWSTKETYSVRWPLLIGCVVVLIHTVVRKTEDLFLDEEAAATTTTESYWNRGLILALFLQICLGWYVTTLELPFVKTIISVIDIMYELLYKLFFCLVLSNTQELFLAFNSGTNLTKIRK